MRAGDAPRARVAVDKVQLFDREHAGADNTRVVWNRNDTDREECVDQPRPQYGDDGDRQEQAGERQEHVHDADRNVVPPAAAVAGYGAKQGSHHDCKRYRYKADLEREPRAINDTAEEVPAVAVHTKDMLSLGGGAA